MQSLTIQRGKTQLGRLDFVHAAPQLRGMFAQAQQGALPAIACYALAAPLVMAVYARFARRKERLANHAEG